MANITFDGTSNVVAGPDDNVIINVDPQTFQSAASTGGAVVLTFNSGTVTVNGGTLSPGGLENVFLSGGIFSQAGNQNVAAPQTNGNVLAYLATGTVAQNTYVSDAATNKIAVFGGQGRVDSSDVADAIRIGGKGSFLVFGNGGNDSIGQPSAAGDAFDSTSVVNVFGDQGADTIALDNTGNNKASIFVNGGNNVTADGVGNDTITVVNAGGSTTIFGGNDSNDGNDTITFNGSAAGAAGRSVIFGNGGDDTIAVGANAVRIDSTSTTTIYGGFGNDSITAYGNKATISVLGGEGADTINVTNSGAGSTYITGGLQSGDQSADGVDNITFTGSGNVLVYGNVGNDIIGLSLNESTSANVSVYGGKNDDNITVTSTNTGSHTIFVAGGEDVDTIVVAGNKGGTTIYGGISANDSDDAGDNITYSSTGGTADIFGNGGNDIITINDVGTADSTNAVVTVRGGIGDDEIRIGQQAAGKQAIVADGNEGADTFTIQSGVAETELTATYATGRNITINNLTVSGPPGEDTDRLVIEGAKEGGTLGLVTDQYTVDQLQAALNAASTKASEGTAGFSNVAAVRVGTDTYVVIENGGANFDASSDQAIKLTGVSDLASLQGKTTINPIAFEP